MIGPERRTAPGRAVARMRLAVAGVWAAIAVAVAYVLAFDPTDRAADPTGRCRCRAYPAGSGSATPPGSCTRWLLRNLPWAPFTWFGIPNLP